jgi:DNA-binding transcriptional MerR regulator
MEQGVPIEEIKRQLKEKRPELTDKRISTEISFVKYQMKKAKEKETGEAEEGEEETEAPERPITEAKEIEEELFEGKAGVEPETIAESIFRTVSLLLASLTKRVTPFEFEPLKEEEIEQLKKAWAPVLEEYMGEGESKEAILIITTAGIFLSHLKKKGTEEVIT